MTNAAWVLAGVLLIGSTACSSSDSKSGGTGGTASQSGACTTFSDLCSKVSAQAFTTACGITATSGVPTEHVPTDPSDPAQISSCQYKGPAGDPGFAQRLCFHDGPAAAKLFYDNEHQPAGGQATDEDLTGLGDKAFYRETLAINEAFVYVLKGNLLVDIQTGQVTQAGGAKMCLTNVANLVLSAK